MKHILKFNEAKKSDKIITDQDIQKIEDLYIDWYDDNRFHFVLADQIPNSRTFTEVNLYLIDKNGPVLECDGLIQDLAILDTPYMWTKYVLPYDILELGNMIGARQECELLSKTLRCSAASAAWGATYNLDYKDTEISIRNRQHIDELFIDTKDTLQAKFLNYLDKHYDIKNQLYDILLKNEGLKYYGFKTDSMVKAKFMITFSLKFRRFLHRDSTSEVIGSEVEGGPYFGQTLFTIIPTIHIKKS